MEFDMTYTALEYRAAQGEGGGGGAGGLGEKLANIV